MHVGLLILRFVVGLLLVGHGTQKLFGWFGGHGLEGTGQFFHNLGYRPGRPMAVLAGLGEAGGGALLVLGFLTPLAGAAIIGTMLNAGITVHRGKGPWASNGGFELPLTYASVAAATAFIGAGRYSVDNAFGWNLAGNGWGMAALLVGVIAGSVTLAVRAAALRHEVVVPEAQQARRAA
jgi:putative oxidoreductase